MTVILTAGSYDSEELCVPRRPRSQDLIRSVFTMVLTVFAALSANAQERKEPGRTVVAGRPATASSPWFWRNLEGEPTSGTVERIDSEGISWRSPDAEKSERIPWKRIEEIRRGSESAIDATGETSTAPVILLPESDQLRGEAVATLTQGLAVQSVSIGIVNVPLAQWAGGVLLPPDKPTALLRAIDLLRSGSDVPGDLILLGNGDRLQGTVLELDADNLKIQPNGADKPVTLSRKGIQGVSIDKSTLEYPPITGVGWKVLFTDGSRVSAREVTFDPADPENSLNLTTRWGAQWRVPLEKLAGLRVLQPGAIELDTVKPAAIQTVDYVGPTEQPRFGTNVQGGPLRIGPRAFDQGIGTQSRTLLAYRLDGTAKTFSAWVGLDNSAGPKASSRAVVLLDGKAVYDSGPLKAGDIPRRVQVDLGSAKLLILATEFGEGGGIRDWVNWCQPVTRP
jgi:hypothetical protein